jgi:1-acyl-sn-glycerol-3-phosphate acyltransferase
VLDPDANEDLSSRAGPTPAARAREADPLESLEQTVDRLILEADSITGDAHARRRAAEALSELASRLESHEGRAETEADQGLLGGAQRLFSPDYYLRQWGRLAMQGRSEVVDDFGLDRTYEARVAPVLEALHRRWFRVAVRGVEHVPDQGRAMIVANHGGALPWDGLVMRTALRLEHPAGRASRWLAEDFVYHMPFLGSFLARVGAVRACPENATRLLEQDELLTVFPEGMKGIRKLYRRRYQLQRFGRGGFVKVALRTGAPIVPAAVIGAEDAYPLLLKGSAVGKLLGLPFVPITPTFPLLGPLGLVPLPTRWSIVFGAPLELSSYGPDAADDALLVNRISDEVRGRVGELVSEALSLRGPAFGGR